MQCIQIRKPTTADRQRVSSHYGMHTKADTFRARKVQCSPWMLTVLMTSLADQKLGRLSYADIKRIIVKSVAEAECLLYFGSIFKKRYLVQMKLVFSLGCIAVTFMLAPVWWLLHLIGRTGSSRGSGSASPVAYCVSHSLLLACFIHVLFIFPLLFYIFPPADVMTQKTLSCLCRTKFEWFLPEKVI